MSDEGFLSRWHRRKVAARQGAPGADAAAAEGEAPADRPASDAPPAIGSEASLPAARATGSPPSAAASAPPAPLPDVASLTPDSDFTPFMRRDVPASMRSAALKKLFADPHFNSMDGLDVYIDDYSKPDPLPPGMLERLEQYAFLNRPLEDEAAGSAEPDAISGGTEEGGSTERRVPRVATPDNTTPEPVAGDVAPQQPEGAGADAARHETERSAAPGTTD